MGTSLDQAIVHATGASPVHAIAFSPDGKTLASGEEEKIHLWDVQRGSCRLTLHGHPKRVHTLAYSPSGHWLASGSDDYTARLWGLPQGKSLACLDEHRSSVLSVTFSPDGQTLATADLTSSRLWKVVAPTSPQSQNRDHSEDPSKDRPVQLHHVLTGPNKVLAAMVFSPDSQSLINANGDQLIRQWDVATGELLRSVPGFEYVFNAIDSRVDGHMLVTGDTTGKVQLWHTQGEPQVQQAGTLASCPEQILTVAFSPDGEHVVATCGDARLYLWHVPSKTVRFVLHDPALDFSLGRVAFSPDGELLATTCRD